MSVRLAVVASHPVQYNAPAFRRLAERRDLDVHVFYGWDGAGELDPEFGRHVAWDIPLLDGYAYTILQNRARRPGADRFWGVDNPGAVNAISAWRPDAILVYGWSFATHLRVLRAFGRVTPVLFRGDSTLLDPRSPLRHLQRKLLLRWVYSHVDLALFTGTRNRAYYVEFGLRPEALVWAPHAVDNDRFAAASEAREAEAEAWRRRLGIPSDATTFLFAAKMSHRKGPDLLLEAFRAMRERRPELAAHLVFVGDGELRPVLQRSAEQNEDVHFLGFQNQSVMPVVYRLGDVLVLPSRYGETWGLSINEAMASGRGAIVSNRVGCAADLLHGQGTGEEVRAGDAAALSDALERVAADRSLGAAWGARARAVIGAWSLDEYARIVADATNVAVSRGRPA